VSSRHSDRGLDVCAPEHTGFYLEPYVLLGGIVVYKSKHRKDALCDTSKAAVVVDAADQRCWGY